MNNDRKRGDSVEGEIVLEREERVAAERYMDGGGLQRVHVERRPAGPHVRQAVSMRAGVNET